MKKRTRRKMLASVCVVTMLLALLIGSGVGEAAKKVKLTIWLGYPELEPWLVRVIEDYKALHPDVEIKVASFTIREEEKKLSIALPAGKGPDIFNQTRQFMAKFAVDESVPILPNPSKVHSFSKKAFPPELYEPLWGGNYYGVPLITDGKALFWNKTMFKEAALPGAPESWGDLIYFSQKLAKYDAAGNLTRSGVSLRLSGAGAGVGQKFSSFLLAAGGSMVEKTPGGKYHNGYDNVAGRDTLQLFIDLVHKYHVDDFMIKHDAEAFALEKTAMFKREGWVVGYMKEHAPQVDYGTVQLPKFRRRATVYDFESLYISKTCKYPETAWDFLLFVQKPKYQSDMFENIGWPPARTVDVTYEDVIKRVPQYRAFVEFPEDMFLWDYPIITVNDEVETKFAEKLMTAYRRSDLVDNPRGITETIADIAKETDKILKKAGLYGLE